MVVGGDFNSWGFLISTERGRRFLGLLLYCTMVVNVKADWICWMGVMRLEMIACKDDTSGMYM